MMPCRRVAALLALLLAPAVGHAGLYYSGEPTAELPSQWRGYLLDQQSLRQIAIPPRPGAAVHPLRKQYLDSAASLEKTMSTRPLTADEQADLGAIYLRLGEVGKALDLLRNAQADHPRHFGIAANLGTAWQMQGDLAKALGALRQAVDLAPGKYLAAEQAHLRLVEQRFKEPAKGQGLDDLFGVTYEDGPGRYQAGAMPADQKKKLPVKAPAIAQQLGLWLPADARLLWQLGELANSYGDVKTAASIMDGCVVQFGLKHKQLRHHRDVLREAVAQMAKAGNAETHQKHVNSWPAQSLRPLLTKFSDAALPAVSATGINALPWPLLAETKLGSKRTPTLPQYLKDLDGKKVTLSGFMQPFKDDPDVASFMLIEYPVGCWFCEMPDMTGIVLVELPRGKSTPYTREIVRVTGDFHVNATDPEEFLFIVRNARIGGVD